MVSSRSWLEVGVPGLEASYGSRGPGGGCEILDIQHTIGWCVGGTCEVACGPAHGTVGRGDVLWLPPLRAATLTPVGGTWSYLSMQVSPATADPVLAAARRLPGPLIDSSPAATAAFVAVARSLCERRRDRDHLLDRVGRLLSALAASTAPGIPPIEPQAVRQARAFLAANPFDSISLAELAAVCRVSKYHLLRVFRDATGLPPHRYHTLLRLAHSQRFLREGLTVLEVATLTGFADQSHFTRSFKRAFGITPGQLSRSPDDRGESPRCALREFLSGAPN